MPSMWLLRIWYLCTRRRSAGQSQRQLVPAAHAGYLSGNLLGVRSDVSANLSNGIRHHGIGDGLHEMFVESSCAGLLAVSVCSVTSDSDQSDPGQVGKLTQSRGKLAAIHSWKPEIEHGDRWTEFLRDCERLRPVIRLANVVAAMSQHRCYQHGRICVVINDEYARRHCRSHGWRSLGQSPPKVRKRCTTRLHHHSHWS
jgi:hypothetical protein